jgi:hypothetical protein
VVFSFCVLLSLGFEDELRGKRDELRAISGGRGRRKGKGWGGASIGFIAPSSLIFLCFSLIGFLIIASL